MKRFNSLSKETIHVNAYHLAYLVASLPFIYSLSYLFGVSIAVKDFASHHLPFVCQMFLLTFLISLCLYSYQKVRQKNRKEG